jgi:DNA-directed RNA polymerase specialized sigma24 family protein
MDYEDIARALNTSVSSVKSLLFRARGVLRDSLAGYLER